MLLFGPPNVEKLKNEGDVKGLVKALQYKKDKHIRHDAALALGVISSVKKPITLAIEPLITSLADNYIRPMSVLSLVRIINGWEPKDVYVTKIINAIVAAYKRGEDKEFQLSIINALKRIDTDVAADVLVDIYGHEEGDIKYAILHALGGIRKKYKDDFTSEAAKADGKFVFDPADFQGFIKPSELESIEAKHEVRFKKIEDTLLAALNDSDENITNIAAQVLKGIGD